MSLKRIVPVSITEHFLNRYVDSNYRNIRIQSDHSVTRERILNDEEIEWREIQVHFYTQKTIDALPDPDEDEEVSNLMTWIDLQVKMLRLKLTK